MTQMVVFDMAGTTVNENNIVYKTVQKAINEKGYDFTFEEVLAEAAGKEKLQAIKSVLSFKGVTGEQIAQEIFSRFNDLLAEAYRNLEVKEQDNAALVFSTLRKNNIQVALNTGYNKQTARSLIQKLNWQQGEQYDTLITASDVEHNRPQPDMILLAMQQLGCTDATQVIKVGDSIIDIEEGKNAGCGMSIGITTGAHTKQQLQTAKPDHIINNLQELLPLLGL